MLTHAQIRAKVEKAELRFEELYPDSPKSGMGRRKTIRGMAFDSVAEELGIKPESVRQAYRRSKVEPRRQTPRERQEFDYLGVEVSELYRRMLGQVLTGVRTCAQRLSAAKVALATVAAKHPFPEPKLKQWLVDFDALFQRTKGLLPLGICPWCKNTRHYRDNCPACYGSGYLVRAQAHAVPARLKEASVIIQNGHELKSASLPQAADRQETEAEKFPWEE